MCCAFLALIFLGPRFFGVLWWLLQPLRWQAAFTDVFSGNLWWILPVLGIVFLPWTTIMFVLVSPGGVVGWDWMWILLTLVADIAWYSSGFGRKRIPNYEGF